MTKEDEPDKVEEIPLEDMLEKNSRWVWKSTFKLAKKYGFIHEFDDVLGDVWENICRNYSKFNPERAQFNTLATYQIWSTVSNKYKKLQRESRCMTDAVHVKLKDMGAGRDEYENLYYSDPIQKLMLREKITAKLTHELSRPRKYAAVRNYIDNYKEFDVQALEQIEGGVIK